MRLTERTIGKVLALGAFLVLVASSCTTRGNRVNARETISLSKLSQLQSGMPYSEVVEVLGGSGSPAGSGVVMTRYTLEDGSWLILNFGPGGSRLLTAYVLKKDGTKKMLLE